jgi:hypothetical protein
MEFILKLTEEDLSVINLGLQEVKMRLAVPVVNKINQQLKEREEKEKEKVE